MAYQLEPAHRRLDCRTCEQAYAAGEQRAFPCQHCPWTRFGPLDPCSARTLEVHGLAVGLGSAEGAPAYELAFRLLGIPVPSAEALEIATRVGLIHQAQQVQRGHQARQAPAPRQSPRGPGTR